MGCDPDKLLAFIEEAGLSYRQNSVSYIFDCVKCGKKNKVYIRKRDGAFICWFCAEIDGYRGRPEIALADLASTPIHLVKEALYGAMAATDEDYFDIQLPDWFSDGEEVDEEATVLETMRFPFDYHPIDHPQARKGREYLEGRGISLELAKEYDLHYTPRDRRVIFPVKVGGRLVGWQGRAVYKTETWSEEKQDYVQFSKMLSSKGIPTAHTVMFSDRLRGSKHVVVCEGPVDAIKCFGRGTQVMLFNGATKSVEDVVVGDLLMGPDSAPRTVTTIRTSTDRLFTILPTHGGEPWVCNGGHILSLQKRRSFPGAGQRIEVSVDDYQKGTPNYKDGLRLWRASLEFSEKELPIPPYVLGAWLGDGESARAGFASMDMEVAREWCKWVTECGDYTEVILKPGEKCARFLARPFEPWNDELGAYVFKRLNCTGWGGRGFRTKSKLQLQRLGVLNNKHIPPVYLQASRRQRLELLAGLLDTDGCLTKNSFRFTQCIKRRRLATQVAQLARSLGFRVCVSTAWNNATKDGVKKEQVCLLINGDLHTIPTRIPYKQSQAVAKEESTTTSFKVHDTGTVGEVFGIETDGDHLFLLNDLTVVHNCHLMGGNVCTMGKAVSRGQIDVIKHPEKLTRQEVGQLRCAGIERVYLALDPDAARETTRLVREFSDLEVYLIEPPPGAKDIGELSLDEAYKAFQNAKRISSANIFVHFDSK